MSVIDDIFLGRIHPCERSGHDSEYAQAMAKRTDREAELIALLDADGQNVYEHYWDSQMEVMQLSELQVFRMGFRLGMQLTLEGIRPAVP